MNPKSHAALSNSISSTHGKSSIFLFSHGGVMAALKNSESAGFKLNIRLSLVAMLAL